MFGVQQPVQIRRLTLQMKLRRSSALRQTIKGHMPQFLHPQYTNSATLLFLRHICSLSHVNQFRIALLLVSATLNEQMRRQSRGLNFTAPFLTSPSVLAIINWNLQVA
jgi:hypothetical protein